MLDCGYPTTHYRAFLLPLQTTHITTFFGKDKAEEFRKLHEGDISDHELARAELKDYKRPYYSNATINAEIVKIKAINAGNGKTLAQRNHKAVTTYFNEMVFLFCRLLLRLRA